MSESNRSSISMKQQRTGKFRHLFGEPAKQESCFMELKNPSSSGESTYVKSNSKYFAVAKAGGGGPVYIRRLDQPGRFSPTAFTLSVHKGTALDFDFHPFVDNIIATGSEDASVCITKFPAEGLQKTINDPDVRLQGHGKKVALVEFNPSANSVLATGAFDHTVRVWNIETAKNVCTYDALDDNIYSMGWNYNGSLLGVTGKDKKLQLFDPRQPKAAQVVESFDGAKASKIFWAPCLNWIGATGHTKQAKRQIKIWDLNNMSTPLETTTLDQASSVLQPMFDNDIGVLFLVGKGDGTISYYELANDDKKLHFLSVYRNTEPQKGGGWVSKKGLDVWKCEVARFLKLTSKSIIPISFIVPRKSGEEIFQADVFPDAFAGIPALTADEWVSGNNKDPVLMTLDPKLRTDSTEDSSKLFKVNVSTTNASTSNISTANDSTNNELNLNDSTVKDNDSFENVQTPVKRPYEEVIEENARLKERVKELEIKLGIYSPSKENLDEDSKVDDNNTENKNNDNDNNNNNDNDNDNVDEGGNKGDQNNPTNDNENDTTQD